MLAKYLLVAAIAVTGVYGATGKCDAQLQFNSCTKTMQPGIDACTSQDAVCLCQAYKALLAQCYNLCPDDPTKTGVQGNIDSWCVSAGGDKTTSTPPAAKPTATGSDSYSPPSTPSSTGSSDSQDSSSNSTNPSGTSSTGSPKQSGSADNLAPAGYLVAAAAAVMGLAL